MSYLSELKPHLGSTKNRKRVGRGDSSGTGGTAGKGHKGQKARSGGGVHAGFEGGQMPLIRRLPKFGFTNAPFKKVYELVMLDDLNGFEGPVNPQALYDAGLAKKGSKIKVLSRGQIDSKIDLTVHKISESAKKSIEEKGGTVEVI